ncbi:MAG: amino acid permease [Bacillota bacterium]|nr:amino acid permease [Bacillota bacterium]
MPDVFMITTGSMIAAGLFVIPGMAYARISPSVFLPYLIVALIALPTVLSAAELTTAIPKAGGIYFFVRRSMGYGAGSIVGFARWFSISMKCAYALLGIGYYVYNYIAVEPVVIAVVVGWLL